MNAFLRVADAKEETDPQLQLWVQQVRDVAYDIQDVVEEFTIRLAHHHGDGIFCFLRKIACSLKNLKARRRIASQVQRINPRVDNLSNIYTQTYSAIEQGSSSSVPSTVSQDGQGNDALLLDEAELVGIDKPKQQLFRWLLDGDSPLKVVSVVGMGGLGKTTLVKKVFEDEQVKKDFQSHAWITVSRSPNIAALLKHLIEQLYDEVKQSLPQRVDTMDIDGLKAVIKEFLRTRRF